VVVVNPSMSETVAPAVSADRLNADFFTLLGLPRAFPLDMTELDARFRELQREVHPDRFAAADDASRRASMMLATQINAAYQTLRSPLKRATYLLELAGIDVGAESNTAMSPEFLMHQMLWREQLDEARAEGDAAALAGLQADIDQAVGDAYERLAGALAAGSEIPVAVETVRQLMFLEKLHQSIDDAQFDLEDR
jgi:molecular chaperone HscB